MRSETAAGLGILALVLWYVFRPLRATVTTSETIDTDTWLPDSTTYSAPIQRLARAIAQAEGYGVPGAIPTIANNPGDLVLPGWTPTLGAAGIAVFDSAAQGWSRLHRQLALILSGSSAHYQLDMSIAEMGSTWAGGDSAWGRNVAASLGVTPTTQLWQVLA